MKLTQEQYDKLMEASKPLMKFLNENCNPHCQVIVDTTHAELVEGIAMVQTSEFATLNTL